VGLGGGFLCSFLIGHTFKLNRHTHNHHQLSMWIFHLLRTHKLELYTSECLFACLLVCMGAWGGVLTSVYTHLHRWVGELLVGGSLILLLLSFVMTKYKLLEVYEIGAQPCKPYLVHQICHIHSDTISIVSKGCVTLWACNLH
jgi:hypothetical protein